MPNYITKYLHDCFPNVSWISIVLCSLHAGIKRFDARWRRNSAFVVDANNVFLLFFFAIGPMFDLGLIFFTLSKLVTQVSIVFVGEGSLINPSTVCYWSWPYQNSPFFFKKSKMHIESTVITNLFKINCLHYNL